MTRWRVLSSSTTNLEDLFVRPSFRAHGIGKASLAHLAKIAVEENCGRFQWQVLHWNTLAIEFYRSPGGQRWLTSGSPCG